MKNIDPIPEAKRPKERRQPSGQTSSVSSGRTVAKPGAPEPPLQDYVAEVSERTEVRKGVPLPLGPHESEAGVNFALFSRHASHVRLELFDHPADATAAKVIDLDPSRNRTGDVWHVWFEGIRSGQLYAYRVDGSYQPNEGHRFNFNKRFWTLMRLRFRDCRNGISAPLADTIHPRQRKT